MTPEALRAQFDVMAEAPNGVQQLRELVLQLAVRGKLVPQDLGDEPAACSRTVARMRGHHQYELPMGGFGLVSMRSASIYPRNKLAEDAIESSARGAGAPRSTAGQRRSYEQRIWRDCEAADSRTSPRVDVAVAKITPCFQNGKAAVMR